MTAYIWIKMRSLAGGWPAWPCSCLSVPPLRFKSVGRWDRQFQGFGFVVRARGPACVWRMRSKVRNIMLPLTKGATERKTQFSEDSA
jgi:hypothetical protein